MNKIPCAFQNTETKTLPADVWVFGCFERLSPAAVHSANYQFYSGVKWWIHVFSIVTYLHRKFLFVALKQLQTTRCYFWSTVSKRRTHFEHSFLIDKCSCKMVNTLPFDIFNPSAISHNSNLRSAKTSLWSFFYVFRDNCRIRVTWAISIICVCRAAFKVSIQPLNRCFRRSRVRITLTMSLEVPVV